MTMLVLWRTAPLRIDVRLRPVEDELVMQLPSGAVLQLGGRDAAAPPGSSGGNGEVLPPRMTTTQRTALVAPPEGLVVYDTTLHALCVRGAAGWSSVNTTAL